MDHVQAIDARDSDQLHGLVLDLLYKGGCPLPGKRHVLEEVQNRSDLILPYDLLQLRWIDLRNSVIRDSVNGELNHLSGFLLEGHFLEDGLNLSLNFRVRRDGGIYLPAI